MSVLLYLYCFSLHTCSPPPPVSPNGTHTSYRTNVGYVRESVIYVKLTWLLLNADMLQFDTEG